VTLLLNKAHFISITFKGPLGLVPFQLKGWEPFQRNLHGISRGSLTSIGGSLYYQHLFTPSKKISFYRLALRGGSPINPNWGPQRLSLHISQDLHVSLKARPFSGGHWSKDKAKVPRHTLLTFLIIQRAPKGPFNKRSFPL